MQRLLITIIAALAITGCTVHPILDTRDPQNQAIVEARRAPPLAEPVVVPVVVPGLVPARVINVVDGDTIDVEIDGAEYRVRYILIDTPERKMPLFAESSQANRDLVSGQTVYLVKDVSETDKYGRLLRYVYLGDGTFVNEELVRQGYAQIATFPPDVAMEATIRDAQAEAVSQGRGLWAGESPACDIKVNRASNGEFIYHMPGQVSYDRTAIDPARGEFIACDEQGAIDAGARKALR